MYTLIYSCFISNTEISAGFFVGFRAENPWKGKYNMIRARIFRPARAGAEFLKLSASPFYFIEPRRSQRRGLFSPCPRTPKGLPFLVGRKGSKRPFKGAAAPLKIPRWGALWPRPQTPRPGNFVVGSSISRAKKCAPVAEKFLLFVKLLGHRTTVWQADSPISSVNRSETSQCNLSLFRPNWAGR